MKVRIAHIFDETQLRTIGAASGRRRRATRKECITFIDRAVRAALAQAPTPAPARVKRAKGPKMVARSTETTEQAIAQRESIRKMYRTTSGATMQDLADRTTAEGRGFFTDLRESLERR